MLEKQPEVDVRAKKMGESNWWHRDIFKRSGSGSDFPSQPYLSAMPLPYPSPMWSHPLFQSFAQTAMPQYSVHTHEQETGGQQSGSQTCQSDKSESPELPGPSGDKGRHPTYSASSDPNHEDSHMGGPRVPCNYPGGFVFPTPYPGQLDSLMFWMHHLQRQTAYSGSRNGHHPTPTSLNGGSQRGFIKIPSGIPQKHSRLWETQSTENMQLWATVTQLSATVVRAEAEMFCQRAKISKLEDDLQLMKVRQDAMSEALKGQTISPQAKRVRKKRNATAPVAILGLPACQPLPVKAQFKKARGLMNDQDASKASHTPSEGGSEETRLNSSLECINTCTLVTEGLDRKESLPNVPSNDKLEGQQGDNDHACTGDMVARQGSQDSCVRGSILVERTKEASGSENVEIKQECRNESTHDVDGCSEGAFFVERKEEACLIESIAAEDLHSGVSNADIEMTKMDESCIVEDRGLRKTASIGCRMTNESINMVREDNWLEGIGGSMEGGLLHGSGDFERPNAKNSWNEVHCAGQKVGMMVSGQQCDKRKNINEAMSEDWTVPNGSEYL